MRGQSIVPGRLWLSITLLFLVVLASVGAYVLVERFSLFDALYMTLTTITTIGGGEPRPLSDLDPFSWRSWGWTSSCGALAPLVVVG